MTSHEAVEKIKKWSPSHTVDDVVARGIPHRIVNGVRITESFEFIHVDAEGNNSDSTVRKLREATLANKSIWMTFPRCYPIVKHGCFPGFPAKTSVWCTALAIHFPDSVRMST